MERPVWSIESASGRRRIGSAGLLLGRSPACDLVFSNPLVSRRHAILHPRGESLYLIDFGAHATEVDGTTVEGEASLGPRSVLRIADQTLHVVRSFEADPVEGPGWVLRHPRAGLFGLAHLPFSVGGPRDHLELEGWPDKALTLHETAGRLSIEAGVPLALDDLDLQPGELHPLEPGQRVQHGADWLQLLPASQALLQTTIGAAEASAPLDVQLEFLPRGARLHVDGRSVYLPERRAELIALLLQPRGDRAPGDLVPDEELIAQLWPRQSKAPNDLNVLIHRVKKSLTEGGLDGARWIERPARTSATRFSLAPGARARVG